MDEPVLQALTKLPWLEDLTEEHRAEFSGLILGMTETGGFVRDDFTKLFSKWRFKAHEDDKRTRLNFLIDLGWFKSDEVDTPDYPN